jgi:hypothetical protein
MPHPNFVSEAGLRSGLFECFVYSSDADRCQHLWLDLLAIALIFKAQFEKKLIYAVKLLRRIVPKPAPFANTKILQATTKKRPDA